MSLWDDEPRRTTPNKALKRIVYERAKGICQLCNTKVDPFDFEIGHNRAHSKGGKLTIRNALLLHPSCNRSMGAMSLKNVRSRLGLSDPDSMKKKLRSLTLPELQVLAKKHSVKVKGKIVSPLISWGNEDYRTAPTKQQFVNALAKVLNPEDLGK